MSYQTILVHVSQSKRTQQRVKIAAKIALDEAAHLIGAAATAVPVEYYLPGFVGESNASLSAYLESLRLRANGALAEFEAIAQQIGVTSVEQRIVNDEAGVGISLQARYSDLVVIGQTNPDESVPELRRDFPEYVVMNSGRPVLIVPYAGRFDSVGDRALVAWDGSIEATRAVTAAIPLLRRSSLVQVVVFNPRIGPGGHGEEPGADLGLYLARHRIKVEVSQESTNSDAEIGPALLSHAADFGADLLVMGGYGHSRLREVLLGGVTDTILTSMTIPTLMVH